MPDDALENESHVPLLPFGETLRPLISSSSLSDTDLKFVLQKRGIFVGDSSKKNTIPKLVSILPGPREFDILKNRQSDKESSIKTSDAKTTWASNRTIVQAIPDEVDDVARELLDEDSPIQLKDCSVQNVSNNEVVINCTIKRQDWTKDVFSQTTHHECKLTIKKEPNSDIVIYHTETTAPETKSFMTELQTVIHNHFRQQGDISKNTPIQKVFAHHFVENKYRFEFLRKFTQPVSTLSFQKIVDLDAGIDHQFSDFPEKFKWLKNKIDKINLHGTKLGETDIMILSEEGVFIFGEIEAEFRFDYSEAKGTCIIRYGFPNYYEKAKLVEFEARVASLQLHASYSHIAKKRVANFVLQEFQREKHKYFEQFKTVGKVDTRTRDLQNQYMFEGEGWD